MTLGELADDLIRRMPPALPGHDPALLPALTGITVAQHLDHYEGLSSSDLGERMHKRLARGRWTLAALISLSMIAAACGDEDDDSDASVQPSGTEAGSGASTTTAGGGASTTVGGGASTTAASTVPSDMDPNGTLKYAARLISSLQVVHFDPIQSACVCTVQYDDLIFGTLMRQAEDGTLEPWMAKDVEVVDSKTVKITLRPGVKFTDGAVYDAEAVKAGLLRSRFQSANAAVATQLHVGLKPLA
ncbi:MAG TPA: hypothetical protein VJL80_13050, partial [Aeromicrobium sp.]|nr:hypothetical protein [Aeromicrobium sp.]